MEGALVISLFVLLPLGLMEVARAFMSYNLLTHALREGARLAVVTPSLQPNDPSVVNRITTLLNNGGVTPAFASVTFIPPATRGTLVGVSAQVNFGPVAAIVFGSTVAIPLQAEITARHE